MKRALLLAVTLVTLLYAFPSYGQMYRTAAGLRGGTGATVSYKHFLGREVAFEGILGSFDYDYFGVSLLFQKHSDANLGRLQWYWGLGPYLTFSKAFTAFGAMGAVGAEYSFSSIPIDISLDWTPRFRLSGAPSKLFTRTVGVGIRYIIEY
jgi:hypothetical protein